MSDEKVRIKCSFSVHYTLLVPVDSEDDDGLDKIHGVDIFIEYCGDMFGLNDRVLEENGITVEESDCYSDPSPTGTGFFERTWEIEPVYEGENA